MKPYRIITAACIAVIAICLAAPHQALAKKAEVKKSKQDTVLRLSKLDKESRAILTGAVQFVNDAWKALGEHAASGKPLQHSVYDRKQHKFVMTDFPESDRKLLEDVGKNWRLVYNDGDDFLTLYIKKEKGDKIEPYTINVDTRMALAARKFVSNVRAVERPQGMDVLGVNLPDDIIKKLALAGFAQNTLFVSTDKDSYNISKLEAKKKKLEKKAAEREGELKELEKTEKKSAADRAEAASMRAEKELIEKHIALLDKQIKEGKSSNYKLRYIRRYSEYEIGLLLLHELVHKYQFETDYSSSAGYAFRYGIAYVFRGGYYNIPVELQAYRLERFARGLAVPKNAKRPETHIVKQEDKKKEEKKKQK